MFLRSEHTYLRALEPTDLDFLYTLENDTSVWHVGNTLTPYSKFVLEQYLENAALDIYTIKQLRLVICNHEQEAIGAIDLFDFDPLHHRAGIGIVVSASYRGQGHAAEALNLLLSYCQHTLQLHQVYCSVTATNHTSIKLFKNAGFEEVGVRKEWLRKSDGSWDDVVEMQRVF
ncbi:GNAT family protein [uncultured Pontibacter sp.]|uniref:GNAT family N-acetyltransferase n=1 Tax=uncultured Pontibacter sp. TaxID=453356 RepID=UPI00262A2884|nr:GNAT family protein [uncultured Pontibacter sp.]